MMQDIYMERIIELYRKPLNWGKLEEAEIKKTDYNPSCGDMINIYVKLEKEKVKDAKFEGQGCAISIASASLLTEYIKGKTLMEIEKLGQKEIFALLGVDLSKNPSRIKCAMLPLTILKQGIRDFQQ